MYKSVHVFVSQVYNAEAPPLWKTHRSWRSSSPSFLRIPSRIFAGTTTTTSPDTLTYIGWHHHHHSIPARTLVALDMDRCWKVFGTE